MTAFSIHRVPFLPAAQVESAAIELLRRCSGVRAKAAVPPVNVEFIAEEVLALNYGVDDLTHLGPDVLGATWFDESMVRVDTTLENKEGRLVFTLAHELGHWQLHRPLYEMAKVEGTLFPRPSGAQPPPAVVCRSKQKPPAETQADMFAAALLMPAKEVRLAAQKALDGKPSTPINGLDAGDGYSSQELKTIADRVKDAGGFTNVSNEAMRIRLKALNIVVDAARFTPQLF